MSLIKKCKSTFLSIFINIPENKKTRDTTSIDVEQLTSLIQTINKSVEKVFITRFTYQFQTKSLTLYGVIKTKTQLDDIMFLLQKKMDLKRIIFEFDYME